MKTVDIDFTEQDEKELEGITEITGKTRNELICEAVKIFIDEFNSKDRLNLLRQARGMWKSYHDLPDIKQLRQEWDRRE